MALSQHSGRVDEEEGKKLFITPNCQIPHFHGNYKYILPSPCLDFVAHKLRTFT